ncbi:hypothetical protein CWI75_02705 [Kineobactrum sediminis]|uniref:Guanylate cyclase domain-containing protein n=1 Tax=Kineobactrum sediminis TaxID=1905677 RepID=A0A2N5Y7A2_9GAMM|nr:hypothetical protein [Kineobactrum sediminis]PLW84268.1 hypothetical protein CWI75_02705 [Kineobactrum sediminis]
MKNRFSESSLSHQLALIAAIGCLLVSLALVALAVTSARHMQEGQQAAFGNALARQIAHRISASLETGDLLNIAASLHSFVNSSSATEVVFFDIEGRALGQAGEAGSGQQAQYRAPVLVANDTAGEVVVSINTETAETARQRFLLSLLGLAGLLSLAAYGAASQASRRLLSSRLRRQARAIALDETRGEPMPANELQALEQRIDALPMNLLRARSGTGAKEEHYLNTAVLYLHLISLADYIDTLDDESLHRYTDRLHQIVYMAAGFYGGELQVVRQFGLAIFFSDTSSSGSAAFRAASCAWLIQAVCRELEKQISLSLTVAMAITHSELGRGDEADIYPGLYIQPALDELQALCGNKPPRVMLSPTVCADIDVSSRLEQCPSELGDYAVLEEFLGPWDDLLERQLRLILRRMTDRL